MLNFKKPGFLIIIASIIVLIAVGVGLMTNTKDKENTDINKIITSPIQKPDSVVYLNPKYSATKDQFLNDRIENEYRFYEGVFEVKSDKYGESILVDNPKYQKIDIKEKINVMGKMSLDISNYNNKQSFHVLTSDGSGTGYIIYKLDSEIWISHWDWYGGNKDAWMCEYILNINL